MLFLSRLQKLTVSETRYRRLFETAQDGILILDADTRRILDSNPFVTEILGYTRQELEGKELWEIGLFRDIEANRSAFQSLLSEGYIRYEDLPLQAKDGRSIDVEFVSNVYLVDQRQIIQCNIRDISDRKQAEAELRRSEAERRQAEKDLDLFFAASPNVLAVTGFDGCFKRLNPAWEKTVGWSEQELLSQPYLDFVHPEDRAATAAKADSMKHHGYTLAGFESRFRCKDGSYRWLSWSAASLPEREMIYAIGKDVTERKRLEQLLLEREAQIWSILHSAVDSIVVIDSRGRVEEFNPAAEQMFGYDAMEVIGQNIRMLMPEPDRSQHDNYIADYLRTGIAKVIGTGRETTARREDGTLFPVEITVSEMRIGSEIKFTGIVRDISKRKQIEQELQGALTAANAASRAKSDFLAHMSHEFRTPMSAVLGCADMLLDPILPQPEKANALQAIRRNGVHLLQMIDDILDLAKIEDGKMEMESLSYSPWQLLQEAISLLQVRAVDKGVPLEVRAVGRLPARVDTDATRVRQILVNLISNAIKFTEPPGRVVVRLSVQRSPSRLCFAVEDEGIGMTQQQIARLFVPFEQADRSSMRKYGGSGLGLSISKRLSQALGGDIEVSSWPGQGSLFALLLPLPDDAGADWVDASQFDSTVSFDGSFGRAVGERLPVLSGRVLVAEDNKEIQHVLAYHLGRAGLHVEIVGNGRVAVEKALQGGFDLILMDMQMPELDGWGAASVLRQSGYQGPIIALTAYVMRGDRERALDSGITDYLTKPVAVEELLTTIARHLPAGKVQQPAAPFFPLSPSLPVKGLDGRGPIASVEPFASGGRSEFSALVRQYAQKLPQQLQAVRAALQAGDLPLLSKLAHQIRGSAGMYEFTAIGETAGLVEEAIRECQGLSLLRELVEELEAAAGASYQEGESTP